MTNYIVMTGNGDLLCDGVSAYEVERVAWADRLAATNPNFDRQRFIAAANG